MNVSPGPIALLGGGEHRDGCEPIDRWLMDRTGRQRVRVTIIPAASPPALLASTAALARNWWSALGADVTVAVPGRQPPSRVAAALEAPDIVVLTGGVPSRLVRALGASAAWERVLDLWRTGTALSASSAGAIALFEWRLALTAPNPLRLVPALGPLRGHVCVPHFARLVGRHRHLHTWVRAAARRYRPLTLLGIDERSALVGDGERWQVRGRGAVTVIDGAHWQLYTDDAPIVLPALGPDTPREPVRTNAPRRQLVAAGDHAAA